MAYGDSVIAKKVVTHVGTRVARAGTVYQNTNAHRSTNHNQNREIENEKSTAPRTQVYTRHHNQERPYKAQTFSLSHERKKIGKVRTYKS
jgi:hypothetical protein